MGRKRANYDSVTLRFGEGRWSMEAYIVVDASEKRRRIWVTGATRSEMVARFVARRAIALSEPTTGTDCTRVVESRPQRSMANLLEV